MSSPGEIWFVGPMPPPVHGFANVCAAMRDLLSSQARVRLLDRSPQAMGGRRPARAARLAAFVGSLVFGASGPLYIGLSGGRGQWVDLFFIVAARLRGRPIYIHHHSFAYIDRPGWRSARLFDAAGAATHIVLSDGMKDALARAYALEPTRIRPLSNAAFMMPTATGSPPPRAGAQTLRIGFLSNITFEKGIGVFFETLESLGRSGVRYEALIAGPVDPAIRVDFDRLLAANPQARHVGPVYGEAKTRFLEGLDVLLFPTRYANEAEPLVIHEAMAAGVFVLACDRGAIPEILCGRGGEALPEADFPARATRRIQETMPARTDVDQARAGAWQHAQALRQRAAASLGALVAAIASKPVEG